MIEFIYHALHGLSPLARGTLDAIENASPDKRFIPAGAGNTAPGTISPARWPVYPRWRGEHFSTISCVTQLHGLSPLARGTLRPPQLNAHRARFIPAGAGNTTPLTRLRPVPAVYPRWRGEHGEKRRDEIQQAGLSPLARGTPNRETAI